MSECDYARRLGAYHDGELPAAKAAEVEEHVRRCPACAAELARIRALSQILKSAQPPQLSSVALDRLHRQVDQQPNYAIRRMVKAVAAAAAAVLVTCTIFFATASGSSSAASLPERWEIAAVPISTDSPMASADEQLATWVVRDLARENTND